MNPISLKFMIEKREGYGEDSPPLSIVKNGFCAVGVFDGMGGSGAAICKSEFGDNHTKAYVASRIIFEAISNYMENIEDIHDINSDGIKSTAQGRLEQEKSNYPTKISGLRSKLVRDYPTTLAITTVLKNEDGTHIINSYWAGDSRNYLWTPEGFYQISKDDLDTELDPLENLRNDGALSNCICADREFYINNKKIQIAGKFVVLSATDGCFNYFATPMHFQEVLLTGLKLSENVEEWGDFCKKEFSAVTGDDVSISLLAIGFNSFDDLKETYMQSTITGIDEIKSAQDEIKHYTSKLGSAKDSLEVLILSEWKAYKVSYMKYFTQEESSNDSLEINVSKEQEIIKASDDEVTSELLLEGCVEINETSDKDEIDLPISIEGTVKLECLGKEASDSKDDEIAIEKDIEIREYETPANITVDDDYTDSKSVSITNSEVIVTSDPENKKDSIKKGRAPIRLSNPSVSSTKINATSTKSEGWEKQKLEKRFDNYNKRTNDILKSFFSINSFDEALTFFQTRIEHSGLSKDTIDIAEVFLDVLNNR